MKSKNLQISLIAVQFFISIGAIFGGYLLIKDPNDKSFEMSKEWLKDSPFNNFLMPGVVLFLANGVGNLIGAILSFMKRPIAGKAVILCGFFLVLWIIFQILIIRVSRCIATHHFCLWYKRNVFRIQNV